MMLKVENLNTSYGISHILFDVNIKVDKGEVVCIIGRNGVGKSTLLRSIMGLTEHRTGAIHFNGTPIISKKPFEISRIGIGFVPEDRIIFPNLTVKENLEMGIKNGDRGFWTFEQVYSNFPVLKDRSAQWGGTLSGGEQQMLTIARTLMGNPELLLLDEPTEGLSPLIVKQLEAQIRTLKEQGLTILLAEQNPYFTLNLSDRAYILEKGAVRWLGDCRELRQQPEVLKKYLGI